MIAMKLAVRAALSIVCFATAGNGLSLAQTRALVNARILQRALQLHGVPFALGVVWYRAVEMAAAGLGMTKALFIRKKLDS